MSSLIPKSIGEIMESNTEFWIPSYQRGYRWTSLQVTELLDDIWEFHKMDPKKDDYYWLQPIIVKEHEDKIEVIDGQQRLTTVLLITKYIQSIIPFYEGTGYTITYETRIGSNSFIANILHGESQRNDNIDYYHMYNALETIREWFGKHPEKTSPVHIWQRLTEQVKVLWYELDPHYDSIDLFTRINIGKIPLTNAELIKALFLSKTNLGNNVSQHEYIKLKQIELATQWDQIEKHLQNPDFWFFLQPTSIKYDNHIEWLFELVIEKFPNFTNIKTSYRTFHDFHDEIERRVDEGEHRYEIVESLWKEVRSLYYQFNEWYVKRELYHLIGHLLEIGQPIRSILSNAQTMRKDAFVKSLYDMIKHRIKDWNISELDYENEKSKVKDTLLLFNILTLQQDENSKQRFDFDRYKNERWDIEHIHALQSIVPGKQEEQLEYIKDALSFVEDSDFSEELKRNLHIIKEEAMEVEEFEKIQQEIVKHFGDEYSNHISNCTLLDAKTNRSYKNSIFPIKREEIIKRDQNGVYIPLCTKNVFLKYYSKKTTQIHHWNQEDREAYMQNINDVLAPVITKHLKNEVISNA
ncbi:DUF262 domain-containing protein [Jeotgalibacillus terrae]|uniref:DUF262 domain-containing protein n=1 Tax=Jeotgalibacillus terrae TaxID=587735 RepID=A0ABW5ZBQ3_9BACL|nr:DUF262 domain-containing protein [Jeotgalibacillus terrae]MBM7577875.1 hypothetical protein [Jeotgalibacillus terrae]